MKIKTMLIAMLLIGIIGVTASIKNNSYAEPISYDIHIVENGDTLWKIAQYSNGYGHIDTRRIIEDMGCEANIHKGDIINVPIYGGINE